MEHCTLNIPFDAFYISTPKGTPAHFSCSGASGGYEIHIRDRVRRRLRPRRALRRRELPRPRGGDRRGGKILPPGGQKLLPDALLLDGRRPRPLAGHGARHALQLRAGQDKRQRPRAVRGARLCRDAAGDRRGAHALHGRAAPAAGLGVRALDLLPTAGTAARSWRPRSTRRKGAASPSAWPVAEAWSDEATFYTFHSEGRWPDRRV